MEIITASFHWNKSKRHRCRDQIMPIQLSMIRGPFVPLKTGVEGGRDQGQITNMLRPVKVFQEILSL